MNKEEKIILQNLLDSYERSKSFKDGKDTSKRILSTFYDKGINKLKEYDIEDFAIKTAYNQACINLKREELIDFNWLHGNKNNIVEKVWLNKENIKLAYQKINRVPKSEYLEDVKNLLISYLTKLGNGWAYNCISEWINNIDCKKSLGKFLPDNKKQIIEYLDIIVALYEQNGSEILERVFSSKVLGDSKKFENMYRARLISLLKRNSDIILNFDEISDRETLAFFGIVTYPEQISFCGDLSVVASNNQVISFNLMKNGAYINARDVDDFGFNIGDNISKIITIENKANYYNYIATQKQIDELVIYHGGCYSPSKGKFFKKIANTVNDEIQFLHWGDIDFGGFSMLKRLRCEISNKYQPFFMSKQDLMKYELSATGFSANYCERLKKLLNYDEIRDCHSCITYMIDKGIRLEQEAMIEI